MGETEINLVVVVDVPVQTPHDLIRRSFQRVSLITSRIIVVFFRQVLADVVHPYEGTVAYRCGVLKRTVHNAVGAPFVIGAATRYARRACLHIILIFAVHEEEQLVFNDRTSQRSSVGGAVVTVAGQFIVLYLVSGEVGIGSVHIGCTFELIRTTLCHGVDEEGNQMVIEGTIDGECNDDFTTITFDNSKLLYFFLAPSGTGQLSGSLWDAAGEIVMKKN